MNDIDFRVVARTKTETEKEGTVYRVRFKSSEGHKLILRAHDKAIFHSYPLGETITVEIRNAQRTLEVESS